jgi:hypothetical protein
MTDAAAYREIARYCRRLLKQRSREFGTETIVQLEHWAVECDRNADRASPASAYHDQARRYRRRAEEYRAVIEQLTTPAARAAYERLARTYETMARQLEAAADHREKPAKHAG